MGEIIADREARFLSLIAADPVDENGVSPADRTMDEMVQRMTGAVRGNDGLCIYQGLPAVCAVWDVPYGRVLSWLMADAGRYERYQRALEVQSHAAVSEAIGIVDAPAVLTEKGSVDAADVSLRKVRVDTRFRIAKYHAPAVYMDRSEVKVDVRHDLAERLMAARARVFAGACERVDEAADEAVL